MPLARRPAGNVLNLPFQGRLLPHMQRVSEWQAISVTPRVRLPQVSHTLGEHHTVR